MNSPAEHTRLNDYNGAIICALAPIVCLAPFVTRAFHIDDPLFLWTAQHIHSNAEPVAYGQTDFRGGDAIICPLNNTNVWPVDESLIASRFSGSVEGSYWLTTMSRPLGAGFYTDLWGPLPYAFGPVPGERYVTLVLNGTGMPFEDVAYHE